MVGQSGVGQEYFGDRAFPRLRRKGPPPARGLPCPVQTVTGKTMAGAIQTGFQRLQFTPDLLPADFIGTLLYNPRTGEFSTKLGPIFSNLILGGEMNSSPGKLQSAMLGAMVKRKVPIGVKKFPL